MFRVLLYWLFLVKENILILFNPVKQKLNQLTIQIKNNILLSIKNSADSVTLKIKIEGITALALYKAALLFIINSIENLVSDHIADLLRQIKELGLPAQKVEGLKNTLTSHFNTFKRYPADFFSQAIKSIQLDNQVEVKLLKIFEQTPFVYEKIETLDLSDHPFSDFDIKYLFEKFDSKKKMLAPFIFLDLSHSFIGTGGLAIFIKNLKEKKLVLKRLSLDYNKISDGTDTSLGIKKEYFFKNTREIFTYLAKTWCFENLAEISLNENPLLSGEFLYQFSATNTRHKYFSTNLKNIFEFHKFEDCQIKFKFFKQPQKNFNQNTPFNTNITIANKKK